jgi:hypothetical protein
MDSDPVTDESVLPAPPEPVVAGCVPAWIAAMIAMSTGVLYIVIIVKQGPPYEAPLVATVALLIAGFAVAAAIAGSTSRTLRTRKTCATMATCGLFVLGFLGIFSIGLPLLIAGGCAATALIKLTHAARSPVAGAG